MAPLKTLPSAQVEQPGQTAGQLTMKKKSASRKSGDAKPACLERNGSTRWWKWVCELCFKQCNRHKLPDAWWWTFQSAICPACQKQMDRDGKDLPNLRGGCYAGKRKDPRSNAEGETRRPSAPHSP